jgi:hypothetical protein
MGFTGWMGSLAKLIEMGAWKKEGKPVDSDR